VDIVPQVSGVACSGLTVGLILSDTLKILAATA